jgi:8-oxo-dGTP diphosphatase
MSEGARIRVVAAVVRREERYLVGRRPEHKRHGGLWEFPGGKVREGESRLDAVRRELAEELDLRVTGLGRVLFSARDESAPFLIDFVETEVEGTPVPLEHAELAWLNSKELSELLLAPADARFVADLRGSSGT